jgi:8-oxo-dGTP pyrophosphatase MutT (NUDIX family)
MWHDSGRVVFGSPPGAEKNDYLLHYAAKDGVPVAGTLSGVIDAAMARIGPGAQRGGGEREVPLLIWRTDSFQRWYRAQAGAGNRLLGARLVWTFRTGPDRRIVVYWALHARVHVLAEDRVKGNEVVISRPDIAAVAMYRRGATADETVVVLIREFRAPAATADGFVHELPGGAIDEPGGAEMNAVRELAEETGLTIDPGRLRCHGSRQLAATVSAHGACLFSAEITDEELAWLRAAQHLPHGAAGGTERTYAEVTTFGQIRLARQVDWATLGMLAQVLAEAPAHRVPGDGTGR